MRSIRSLCGAIALIGLCSPAFAENAMLKADFWKGADLAKVKAAVEGGASATETDKDQYSPLYRALLTGTKLDVVQYLVDQGADVHAVGYDNLSPLMLAARYNTLDILDFVLSKEPDLSYQDDSWRDALQFACLTQKDHAVYQRLMDLGLDVTVPDIHGRNCALSVAYLNPDPAMFDYVATIDDINAEDNNGNTILLQAAMRNPKPEVVKAALDRTTDKARANKDGDNALLLAAVRQKDVAILKMLAEAGIDAKAKNNAGRTGLHIAASGNTAEVAQFYLDAGVGVNQADAKGQTALMLAAINNTPEVVAHLIAAGADVNVADAEGKTALAHAMAREKKGRDEIVKALQDAGAK